MAGGDSGVFKRLVAALEDKGVSFVRRQHKPVYTSTEAAAARGTSLHSGAKALIVKAQDSFLMAVIPADSALDSNALRKHLKCRRLRFATKEELLELTGLTPGSIPPFGSLFGLQTICDARLSDNQRINFSAGSHTNSIQMTYEAYIGYESPQFAKVAKPPEQHPES